MLYSALVLDVGNLLFLPIDLGRMMNARTMGSLERQFDMELVEHLVDELGVSARQAAGGAGLLLGLAQQRMTKEDFVRLAVVVPAISDAIGKAPRNGVTPSSSVRQTLSRWFGGLGGLVGVVEGFEKLDCDKAMISRFAIAVVDFFRQKGGGDVAESLDMAFR